MRRNLLALSGLIFGGCVEYDLTEWDQVEVFNQEPPEAVDILMVVDNSCSMGPYQANLGDNFEQFVQYFIGADVDYQIGVVTTDMEDPSQSGRIQGQIITQDTPNPASVFNSIVNVGTYGSGWEYGLEAALKALTTPLIAGPNAGFLREDASLSLIFVSDEEDGSPYPVNQYINQFLDVKGARQRDIFNASALTVTDLGICDPFLAAQSSPGTRYVDVARQTNGVIGNLCDEDFESIVTELSLNTSRLRNTYFLEEKPDPGSLEVRVSPDGTTTEPIPCEDNIWYYDLVVDPIDESERPAVIFPTEYIPAVGSKISVKYFKGGGNPVDFCVQAGGAE
jgi:hypothetical protein